MTLAREWAVYKWLCRPLIPSIASCDISIARKHGHPRVRQEEIHPSNCLNRQPDITMVSSLLRILLGGISLVGIASALPQQPSTYGPPTFDHYDEIIKRDVVVIGGGSAGTYTAIRLKQSGKSVVVVEQKDKLGGHTETYTEPATGVPINIGVVVWNNIPVVHQYAASLGVALANVTQGSSGSSRALVDLRTGKPFTSSQGDVATALGAYAQQLLKYPYLNDGFELPKPIPDDLLLPFGQFVQKYNLGAAVIAADLYGQGAGDILNQPTIYVLKLFNMDVVREISTASLTAASGNNHVLYDNALKQLGTDALLSSSVILTNRDGSKGVQLLVKTPSGIKFIQAAKLVIACPPTLNNLGPLQPSASERALFGQWSSTGYYTGVLRNTGLPPTVSITNGAPETPYQLPILPATYILYPTGIPNVTNVKYGSPSPIPDDQVKADILAALKRLGTAGTYPVSANPELAAYSRHVPFFLTVPPSAIKAGFYDKVNALQGQRHTWYTGAAFQAQNSAAIWNFTEYHILPKVLA